MTLLEAGVTPVYVLEGKSPVRKSSEVQRRKDRKKKIKEKIALAQEFGDEEGVQKYSKQLINVTQNVIEESGYLLKLLGVPVIQVRRYCENFLTKLCGRLLVNQNRNAPSFVRKDKPGALLLKIWMLLHWRLR